MYLNLQLFHYGFCVLFLIRSVQDLYNTSQKPLLQQEITFIVH